MGGDRHPPQRDTSGEQWKSGLRAGAQSSHSQRLWWGGVGRGLPPRSPASPSSPEERRRWSKNHALLSSNCAEQVCDLNQTVRAGKCPRRTFLRRAPGRRSIRLPGGTVCLPAAGLPRSLTRAGRRGAGAGWGTPLRSGLAPVGVTQVPSPLALDSVSSRWRVKEPGDEAGAPGLQES